MEFSDEGWCCRMLFVDNPNKSLCCIYMNAHSKYITKTLGCNVLFRCVLYVVHYSNEPTQKEDKCVDLRELETKWFNILKEDWAIAGIKKWFR